MKAMKLATFNFRRLSLSFAHGRDGEHLRQRHLRMVIPLVPRRFFAELDRLGRTPLDAGEALFAMVQPNGPVRLQRDVSRRADALADTADGAFLIDPETPDPK